MTTDRVALRHRIAARRARGAVVADHRTERIRQRAILKPWQPTVPRVLATVGYGVMVPSTVAYLMVDTSVTGSPYLWPLSILPWVGMLCVIGLAATAKSRLLHRPSDDIDERELTTRLRAKARAFDLVLVGMGAAMLAILAWVAAVFGTDGTLPQVPVHKLLLGAALGMLAVQYLPIAILAWITPPEEPTDDTDLPERT